MKKLKQHLTLFLLFLPMTSFANTMGSFSWENILGKISKSLSGPVIYAIAIIAIIICGIVMAFADLQGGAKRFVQVCCGLSLAFFAGPIVTGFLGFSGALI